MRRGGGDRDQRRIPHLYRGGTPPGTNASQLYRVCGLVQMCPLICTGEIVPVQQPVQMRVMDWYK
jgi:hypothetical protein